MSPTRGTSALGAGTALAVAGVVLLAAWLAPSGAGAQNDPPEAGARLVVTSLDGMVGQGTRPGPDEPESTRQAEPSDEDLDLRLLVENTGDVDLSDLQVVVEVHPPVGGARSVLQEALDEQSLETQELEALSRVDLRDGEALPRGRIAGLEISVDADEIGWQDTNEVYPVQVSVLLGAEVLDRVVTAVVHLADRPDHPLQASVVWPIDAPNRRTAAGRYEEALPSELAPGGRIDVLLTTLEQHPEAPVLLAPEVGLVEELADRGDGFRLVDGSRVPADATAARQAADLLSRLRALVEQAPLDPVIGPYAGADVAALAEDEELATLADVAVDAARHRTQALLGRAPDLGLYLGSTPVTETLLEHLAADRILLSYDQVVGPALETYPDLPAADRALVGVAGPGTPDRATVADPHVAGILDSPSARAGPVVARQHLVAETALLYLAEPSRSERSLLAMPPTDWAPSGAIAQHLLDGLVASPWLELGRPVASPRPDRAVLSAPDTTVPPGVRDDLTATQRRLEALRQAMVRPSAALGDQTVADLEDALLRAVTPEALQEGGELASERIDAVDEVAGDAFGEVELAEGSRVTLTSETGEVPVTLERTGGSDINLLVEVRSPNALRWEDGTRTQEVTLPADSSQTVSFSTRALSTGTFPVRVYVWDPTQDEVLDVTVLSVRSTTISRTALVAIGGFLVLLLLVGLVRRRSPRLEVVR